jgi:phosphorylcholine metabolism protein LicD
MTENKNTAVIFGAGLAGIRAYKRLKSTIDILAFVDNDKTKYSSRVEGLAVWSLSKLQNVYKNKERLHVFIASEFSEQIKRILAGKIAASDMSVLSAEKIAKLQFGESQDVHEKAITVLKTVSDFLKNNKIPHHIDAGTLLGLYRDKRLIAWDDDLDFSINFEHIQDLTEKHLLLTELLEQRTSSHWHLITLCSQTQCSVIDEGNIRGVKLVPSDDFLPNVDFFVKYRIGNFKDYALASRVIRMPAEYTETSKVYSALGYEWLIPCKTDEYLTYHYGDWQTPNKSWCLEELKNAEVFVE